MEGPPLRASCARLGADGGGVHLALAADRHFLPYCAATIASVLAHCAAQDRVTIHLLTDADLPAEDAERFEALHAIHGFELNTIVVDASSFAHLRTTPGISVATYYRLFLPRLLPRSVQKVLYLDCDLIVLDRVRKLFDIDMGAHFILGVEDSLSRIYNDRFDLPAQAAHINGGVMLLNLAALRGAGFEGQIADYVDRHKYVITLGDQQIINALFHPRIGYVDPRWNVHGSMFNALWRLLTTGVVNGYAEHELDVAVKAPGVVHYTARRKPWLSLSHPRAAEYLQYFGRTAYAGRHERLIARSKTSPARMRTWLRTRFDVAAAAGLGVGGGGLVEPLSKGVEALYQEPRPWPAPQTVVRGLRGRAVRSRDGSIERWMREVHGQATRDGGRLDGIGGTREFAPWACSALEHQIRAGELMHCKSLLRSNDLRTPLAPDWEECDALFAYGWSDASWRHRLILRHAAQSGKPMLFLAAAPIGACVRSHAVGAALQFRRPCGFLVDDLGFPLDERRPSRLRTRLQERGHVLTRDQLERARRLMAEAISLPPPEGWGYPRGVAEGHVLVALDLEPNRSGSAIAGLKRLLVTARRENPAAEIVVHAGYEPRMRKVAARVIASESRVRLAGPMTDSDALVSAARKVYVGAATLGLQALIRRKPVVCLGTPFYAGLGLTDDRAQGAERSRVQRSVEELFHIVCVEMSRYVDPSSGRECTMEQALAHRRRMEEAGLNRLGVSCSFGPNS